MAFCRFCGKQIPDGGACDCAASKAAAEAGEKVENAVEAVKDEAANAVETVKAEAAQAAETVKENVSQAADSAAQAASNVQQQADNAAAQANNAANQAGSGFKQLNGSDIAKKVEGIADSITDKLPENVKKNKSLLYAGLGAAALLLCLILCVCLFGGGSYKKAVKKYVNCQADEKGGKTYISLTLPKSAIKALKEEDTYEDEIDDFNDDVEDAIDDLEDEAELPKFNKFVNKKKLKKTQLKNAEKYFEAILDEYDADDDEVKITKGYEVKFKTVEKDEDGEKDYERETVCVVKLRGDGWKIIECEGDDLKLFSSLSSSFTDYLNW